MVMIMKKVCSLLAILIFLTGLTACKKSTQTDSVSSEAELFSSSEFREALRLPKEPVQSSEEETSSQETPVESVPEPVYVPVESLTLTAYEKAFTVGESFMPIVTMSPRNATDKSEIWQSSDASVATVNNKGRITAVGEGECVVTVTSVDNPAVKADFKVTASAPAQPASAPVAAVAEPTYIGGILIANKSYPLPADYNPGTNPEAKAALDRMFADAAAEGLSMRIASGFRSYATQKSLYQRYVKRDGVQEADRYSARPGYSEHQTGLAFDINRANMGFAGSPEALWLEANAYKYGFILRYPEGKESITGYMLEPWHYRYVGVENAKMLFDSGLTIEEYFGITSCYSQ